MHPGVSASIQRQVSACCASDQSWIGAVRAHLVALPHASWRLRVRIPICMAYVWMIWPRAVATALDRIQIQVLIDENI